MVFEDRADAGRRLAQRFSGRQLASPLVLGLPRGGVPVAAEVAAALAAPLEVFGARKVGMPGQEELGIGAVAEDLDEPVVSAAARLGLTPGDMRALAGGARRELERRVALYRGGRRLPELAGRDVVLVDDGLATGVTAEAALRSLRAKKPGWLVLAVPVCAPRTAARLASVADEVVYVAAPSRFVAVGQWYRDFTQTSDDEVIRLLGRGNGPAGQP